MGRIAKEWVKSRQEWIGAHPGPWKCYICNTPLDIDTLTLDHVKSRSRRPDLRFDQDNLMPCCWSCNEKKGSK